MAKKTYADLFDATPQTAVEAQAWRRKYALARLNGTLEQISASASQKKLVVSLVNQWEKRFRREYAADKPDEKQYVIVEHNLLEDQIDFIIGYVACMLCPGPIKETFDSIEQFLAMQGACNVGNRMELRFVGGSPIETYVFVDALSDVDIADVFFVTSCFDMMIAFQKDQKLWTKKTATAFLRDFKKDIFYDLPKAKIITDPSSASGYPGFAIQVQISQDDDALLLQTLRYSGCLT